MVNIFFNGRLGADAEIRETKNGTSLMTFNVAVDDFVNGEKATTWIRVRSTQNLNKAPYLKKGSLVSVNGVETVSTFLNKAGETMISRDVLADRIEYVRVGNGNSSETAKESVVEPTTTSERREEIMTCGTLQPQVAMSQVSNQSEDIDDLPF